MSFNLSRAEESDAEEKRKKRMIFQTVEERIKSIYDHEWLALPWRRWCS